MTTLNPQVISSNTLQIHEEITELAMISGILKIPLDIAMKNKEFYSSLLDWERLVIWAKQIYDNTEMWNSLPDTVDLKTQHKQLWIKQEARNQILDCYDNLGGEEMFKH